MSKKIFLNGTQYIGSKDAGKSVGYSYDYVSRLARQGVVKAEKVGNSWFVDPASLEGFAKNQKINTSVRSKQLSQQITGAMGTANKTATPATHSGSLSGMASAKTNILQTGVDNALRMQSIAKSSTMRAFGAGTSGMMSGSLSPSVSGLGSGMSAMGMANKLVALVTATSLVFGLYSFTDPQYTDYVKSQASDIGQDALAIVTDLPNGVLALTDTLGAGFASVAQAPDTYAAGVMLGASALAGNAFERLARSTTSTTDTLLASLTGGFSLFGAEFASSKTVVRIGVQELPQVESELRALVAQREYANAYNAELGDSSRVVSGGTSTADNKKVAVASTQIIKTIVREVELRKETVREVVPLATLQTLVGNALDGGLREGLRTELLGVVNDKLRRQQVSTRGALSLTQRIDTLGGVDFDDGTITNSPISGSTGSFTTLSASGATSLAGITATDLTLSNGLTVSGGDVILPSDVIDSSEITDGTIQDEDLDLADITISDFTNDAGYITAAGVPVQSVFGRTGAITAQTGDYTTTQVTEGTNLYYTDARSRGAVSETITGIDYSSGTGVFSLTSLYSIPLTASTVEWDSAFSWGDHSLVGYIESTSLDSEAELEGQLTDVSNVFTNNDQITGANIATDTLSATDIAAGAIGSSELASSGVAAGTYGTATLVPVIDIDIDGRITGVTTTTITVAKNNITNSGTLGFDWDISDETNLVAGSDITLTDDTLSIDDSFIRNDGNDTTTGTITAAGFTTGGSLTLTGLASGTTSDHYRPTKITTK